MTEILQRYRIAIIIAGLLFLITLVWFIVSRQNLSKIPSRGVFVNNSVIDCRGSLKEWRVES